MGDFRGELYTSRSALMKFGYIFRVHKIDVLGSVTVFYVFGKFVLASFRVFPGAGWRADGLL